MAHLQRDAAVDGLTTLALPGRAELLCQVNSRDDLTGALAVARREQLAVTLLGGGSNTVIRGDIPGLVLLIALKGIAVVEERDDQVVVDVAAGENWHQFVVHCLNRGWYGLENLALIPGSVGAAPVQNIGAYGVELATRLVSVEVTDIATGEERTMAAADCRLAYRDSIFKQALRHRVVITSVRLVLAKQPVVDLSYGELAACFDQGDVATPGQVFDAVCTIRRAKLPDPASLANAGSFFKNPVVDVATTMALRERFADMPCYFLNDGSVKLAAAWLIDRAGWKGRRRGAVGVHDRQALVLVNYGGASGDELLSLAEEIARDIDSRYGVSLELEPVVVGGAGG